jgi:solute carrier family 50 protein (sugar transporter)
VLKFLFQTQFLTQSSIHPSKRPFKSTMLPMSSVTRGISSILPTAAAAATSSVPGWVSLCGNIAPMAAMVVFFAVSDVCDQPSSSLLDNQTQNLFPVSSQPYPTINQVSKEKSVGSLPLLPYSSMIANCFLWLMYGVLKQETKIWGTNLIGLTCGLFYFLKFSKYAPPKAPTLPGSIRQHVNVNLAVMAATFSFMYLLPLRDPTSIIGNLAVLFCIAMFGSPLASLKTVLQTKSAKSIPLPFTLATVVNCFFWSVTGLLDMKDANIYIPNLLGLTFGLAQVALKFLFSDGISRKQRGMELLL